MSCFLLLRYSSQNEKTVCKMYLYVYIYIYMLYIIITIIQRSAVFRRSDVHPATCTLPSLRQAPAVFSFASETATCNTSHTIRNESWSDSIFVLKVDLSGFNSIPSAIFSRPPINTLTVKDWYTYLY